MTSVVPPSHSKQGSVSTTVAVSAAAHWTPAIAVPTASTSLTVVSASVASTENNALPPLGSSNGPAMGPSLSSTRVTPLSGAPVLTTA